ncbi:MAG TPA: translesion error-prone DNA polymerase V autoproteolytic subunit [Rhodospirillales bacterium]|nr:translesion error-prone DNA polymerase V autoproteolytic subunit [Rhodospirillales bacterium]
MIFAAKPSNRRRYPLFASRVAAGFPSPAEDHVEGKLDLNEHLIKHPAATFIVRVEGASMTGAGIHPGDLLIVDRSLEPRDGSIVVAAVNGELTVKRLRAEKGGWVLKAENPDFPDIPIAGAANAEAPNTEDVACAVWGVATNAIHSLGPP